MPMRLGAARGFLVAPWIRTPEAARRQTESSHHAFGRPSDEGGDHIGRRCHGITQHGTDNEDTHQGETEDRQGATRGHTPFEPGIGGGAGSLPHGTRHPDHHRRPQYRGGDPHGNIGIGGGVGEPHQAVGAEHDHGADQGGEWYHPAMRYQGEPSNEMGCHQPNEPYGPADGHTGGHQDHGGEHRQKPGLGRVDSHGCRSGVTESRHIQCPPKEGGTHHHQDHPRTHHRHPLEVGLPDIAAAPHEQTGDVLTAEEEHHAGDGRKDQVHGHTGQGETGGREAEGAPYPHHQGGGDQCPEEGGSARE